jgi:hypothetical protein
MRILGFTLCLAIALLSTFVLGYHYGYECHVKHQSFFDGFGIASTTQAQHAQH